MLLLPHCKTMGCNHRVGYATRDYCEPCTTKDVTHGSDYYPEAFRCVGDLTEIDAYAVHHLFQIQDPSGCIQHASRKLLSVGGATKPAYRDIKEARDTLTRWLQLNQETTTV